MSAQGAAGDCRPGCCTGTGTARTRQGGAGRGGRILKLIGPCWRRGTELGGAEEMSGRVLLMIAWPTHKPAPSLPQLPRAATASRVVGNSIEESGETLERMRGVRRAPCGATFVPARSGALAMDKARADLTAAGDKVRVAFTGASGDRFAHPQEWYGAFVPFLRFPVDAAIDSERVGTAPGANGQQGVAAKPVDASTTVRRDPSSSGELGRRRGAPTAPGGVGAQFLNRYVLRWVVQEVCMQRMSHQVCAIRKALQALDPSRRSRRPELPVPKDFVWKTDPDTSGSATCTESGEETWPQLSVQSKTNSIGAAMTSNFLPALASRRRLVGTGRVLPSMTQRVLARKESRD